jgi:precorrin-6B methylase 2
MRPHTQVRNRVIVDKAIELAPRDGAVFEMGVGSGAVITSILLERPDLIGFGNDISLESVKVARKNAERLGVPAGSLSLFVGDAFNALSLRFPMVVVNPPYVSETVRSTPQGEELRYEPGHALFAGNDGLDVIREIIARAPDYLVPGGKLIMEMGFDQKGAVEMLVDAVRYLAVGAWIRDLAGIDRAVVSGEDSWINLPSRVGAPLRGEVTISGSKNAALPILCSSILADGPCTYTNVPRLLDIATIGKVLETLGAKFRRTGDDAVEVDPTGVVSWEAPYDLVKSMRASITVLGPHLAKYREAKVSHPAAAPSGLGPSNLHLKALAKMGADISLSHGYVMAKVERPAQGDYHCL